MSEKFKVFKSRNGSRFVATKSPRSSVFTAAKEREVIDQCLKLRDEIKPAPCPIYRKLPNIERLTELFSYDSVTGELSNKITLGHRKKGQRAGCFHNEYRKVSVDGVQHMVHRIVWKMTYGSDPLGQIDHISGDRCDNRIENLRDVLPLSNSRNRTKTNSNTGHLGVSWCNSSQRYLACIGLGSKTVHLGQFVELSCAVKARKCAEQWLYGALPLESEAA